MSWVEATPPCTRTGSSPHAGRSASGTSASTAHQRHRVRARERLARGRARRGHQGVARRLHVGVSALAARIVCRSRSSWPGQTRRAEGGRGGQGPRTRVIHVAQDDATGVRRRPGVCRGQPGRPARRHPRDGQRAAADPSWSWADGSREAVGQLGWLRCACRPQGMVGTELRTYVTSVAI